MKTKTTIKDIDWEFIVVEDSTYDRVYGRDSHGITIKDVFSVYIRKSSLSKKLITHELLHVYVSSCCINSMTELQTSDMEELCAEILEFHIDDLVNHAKKIYNKLNRDLKKTPTAKATDD